MLHHHRPKLKITNSTENLTSKNISILQRLSSTSTSTSLGPLPLKANAIENRVFQHSWVSTTYLTIVIPPFAPHWLSVSVRVVFGPLFLFVYSL